MSTWLKTAIYLVSGGSEEEKVWCSGVFVNLEITKTSFGNYRYVPIQVTVHPTRGRSSVHPEISQLDLYLSIEKSGRKCLQSKIRGDGDLLCHESAILFLMQ
jgi:hypothetical protein